MNILIFKDNEISELIEAINLLQIIFHPHYMELGEIKIKDIFELQSKDNLIFLDSNLLSPIYDLGKYGKSKNKRGLQIAALIVIFSKLIHARITAGLALIENDSNSKKSISSEEKVQYCLHAIDEIPLMVWKGLAWELINEIPKGLTLQEANTKKEGTFEYKDNSLLKQNKIALIKMVYILRNKGYGFDSFYIFLKWYIDNLLFNKSLIVYTAMIFGNIDQVKAPKNMNNMNFNKVIEGIENQAWDIYHLTQWKKFQHLEKDTNKINFFATNDNSLKFILVNSLPGEWLSAIYCIFKTKKEQDKIESLVRSHLFENRIYPFDLNNKEEIQYKMNLLLIEVEKQLHELITKDNQKIGGTKWKLK